MTPIYRLVFVLLIVVVQVVKYQELTAEISAKLPEKLRNTASVYDGEDAFYIIGGNADDGLTRRDVYKYSLSQGTVTREGSLPSSAGFSGSAVIDDKKENLYYFGGYDRWIAYSDIYKFNLATKSATLVGNLPSTSYWHAAIKYTDVTSKVFIIGGTSGKAIQCWDIDLQSNCPTQTIDTSLGYTSAVLYKNEVFAFGDANGTSENDPVYKINLDTFQTSFGDRSLPSFNDIGAAVIAGSNAYIIGGWSNQADFPSNSIIQIDLVTLKQTVLTVNNLMPNQNLIFGVSAVYVEKLNRVFVAGGYGYTHGEYDEVWSIDLSSIYVPPIPTTAKPTSSSPPTSSTSRM